VQVRRAPVLRDATGYVRGYLPYLSFDLPLAVRLLTSPRPDVVVVEPPPTTGAVTRTVLAVRNGLGRPARRRPVPYVYYAADVWSEATASTGAPAAVVALMRWVERFALRGARDVLAVSDGVADRVRALVGEDVPVTVVPNGIDTNVFTPEGEVHAEAPGTPYLVYAGTASEWQGAEIFAEAMGAVLSEEPDARLVFLGQGSSWPVLQRIRDTLPDGAIELRPLAPPAEAAAWQRGAAAALVSVRPGVGYDFAYPTKVIAAVACGTPVVFAGPGPAAADVREHELGEAVGYDVGQVARAMLAALRAHRGGGDATAADRRARWARTHRSLTATGRAAADVVLRDL
jgi:glycosyltransferase involved in cell wall biosynthesis